MQTELIELLKEIDNWLVCSCIATPEDMAQSFEPFHLAIEAALAKAAATIDLDLVDWNAIQEAASQSTWMPPEYYRNEWVSDVCSWLKDGPPVSTGEPKRKLEIEGSPSDGYGAWLTDTDGNLHTVVIFDHPFAAADWCEHNGFAWEVIGLMEDRDPLVELAAWRAAQ